MRLLLALISIAVCNLSLASETLDFEFSATLDNHLRSISLSADIERDYGFKLTNPRLLLIETKSLSTLEYIEQRKVLDELGHDAENYQLLYVVSNIEERLSHRYSTSIEVAKKMNPGKVFRIRLLSSIGKILNESSKPISITKLKSWLEPNDS